jgi:hypothetical protein
LSGPDQVNQKQVRARPANAPDDSLLVHAKAQFAQFAQKIAYRSVPQKGLDIFAFRQVPNKVARGNKVDGDQ